MWLDPSVGSQVKNEYRRIHQRWRAEIRIALEEAARRR